MIYDVLRRWQINEPRAEVRQAGLVFHTSCVNYDLEDLENLMRFSFRWILPDNVYWELRLLCDSQIFGAKAAFLLKHAHRDERWDIEQFYENCSEQMPRQTVYDGLLLFLFGDLLKQDEFLAHARAEEGTYILLRSTWNCGKDEFDQYAQICSLREVKGYRMCRATPLEAGRSVAALNALPVLSTDKSGRGIRTPGSAFQPIPAMRGGNAQVYTNAVFPDKLVKCYREYALTGAQEAKLRTLQIIGQHSGSLPLAIPIDLIYCQHGCVGYTMRALKGEMLENLIADWNQHDIGLVFQRLFLLLLELHAMHIIVNDLSSRNVLVDEEDRISLVDCDSFQVFWFPGGTMTECYRHPDIDVGQTLTELREPRYEDFALAVLLFQCLFFVPNPLIQMQSEKDDTPLDWDHAEFPLDNNGEYLKANGTMLRANQATLKRWMSFPEEIRRTFAGEFHFRRDYSIGAWIRAFQKYLDLQ